MVRRNDDYYERVVSTHYYLQFINMTSSNQDIFLISDIFPNGFTLNIDFDDACKEDEAS